MERLVDSDLRTAGGLAESGKRKGFAALDKCLNVFGMLVCLLGVLASVRGNFPGRSLYVDEASVVYSIQTRSIWGMTASPLPFNQTAPVLWLWLVKLSTLLFGASEVELRALSVSSYITALLLTAWSAKRFFGVRCPWLASAFLANTRAFLCYSNVVKPYEFEAVCVLLVLIAYGFRREEKLPWSLTGLVWALAMLGGNPSLFFVGACLLHEGTEAMLRREWRHLGTVCTVGAALLGGFAVYYFWWLRGVAESGFMQDWWQNRMLSAWPLTGKTLLGNVRILVDGYFNLVFGRRAFAVAWLLSGSVVLAWTGTSRLRRLLPTGFALALAASCFRLFPIDMRIWVFSLPVCAILLTGLASDLMSGRSAWTVAFLGVVLVVAQLGIPHYWHRDDIYWIGEELNPLLDYVKDHLADDESVYVIDRALPGVKYHFGYDFERFGTGRDNVIWGSDTWGKTADLGKDARRIEAAGKCWLILIPGVPAMRWDLFRRLSHDGSIEKVCEFHETPLYYYSRTAPASQDSDGP